MIYIITPCSRPENLNQIYNSIPKACNWIVCHDKKTTIPQLNGIISMTCEDTGFVGTKARNHVLDNFPFKDDDYILFHDDDNIIHPSLYENLLEYIDKKFSIMTWGQLNRDNSIRLHPTPFIRVGSIDTASFIISWKYNKHIRHRTDIYEHDGIYAEECSRNGPVLCIDDYLCYYNFLRQ